MPSNISIIVPAFNVENFIAEAIKSILAQTLLPLEIIIVDDGSTDSTGSRIAPFTDNSIITIVRTENRGLGSARNLGRNLASGKYIYYFDSDDRLAPNFIEVIERYIDQNAEPDIVFFSGECFFDDNFCHDFFPDYRRKLQGLFTREMSPLRLLIENNSFMSSACLYVSKKSLWESNDLAFEPILHEDEQVIFPLIAIASSVLLVEDVFFFRRIRSGSIMTSGRGARNAEGYLAVIKSLIHFYRVNPQLVTRDADLWLERIKDFTFIYLLLAKELKLKISYWTLFRGVLVVNQPRFYKHCLEMLLPRKCQLIFDKIWGCLKKYGFVVLK